MKEVLAPQFTLEQAVKIATDAHEGQLDKSGMPYITHPLAVMAQLEGDDAKMVGVLHDVVEDTPVGFAELEGMGCPQHVLDALKLVTHAPEYTGTDEEYRKKIESIAQSGNQLAIDVKWADLTHNSDITRIAEPQERDHKRIEKYKAAKKVLRPVVSGYLRDKLATELQSDRVVEMQKVK